MMILGIDPGLAIVGFALLSVEHGKNTHIAHGVIRTDAGLLLEQRLFTIAEDLQTIIDTYNPAEAAIERLYFNKNVTTGIPVAHARGVTLLTLYRNRLKISDYAPQDVKMAVTGYGNAEKNQVIEMTQRLLHLKNRPKPDDAADALAIALCHAQSRFSLLRG